MAGCSGTGESEPGRVIRAEVERVVDGDTITARVDGESLYVRYIGVDTPESVAPGEPVECFGPEAAERNRLLVEGRTVRLVVGEEPYDPYDRLLAYVYTDNRMVNAELIRTGMAETLTIPPNDRFSDRFERLETAARDEGRGRWSYCG